MKRKEIEIGRAILNLLTINGGVVNRENLFSFLSAQRGYKRNEITLSIKQLEAYKLIEADEEGIEKRIHLTTTGTRASGMGLKAYLNSIDTIYGKPKAIKKPLLTPTARTILIVLAIALFSFIISLIYYLIRD